ncbi:myb-related protein 308-like protein [Cucumis melo var. makuwa]|uniref:Myb-related protein 308-like protein n=2 Tax=Cucumis melo TaxID=3656 RepID=A0A5A7T9S7_CUCMM|nr:myb-related protein 308-like protein [Cucumis melo var. makuwa]TYK24714.1 myb-related protein 308-like protein [Cucumis melo var. makuwa]
MEDRRSQSHEVLRKGPWKLEEDEVLLNHVNRFGPRDWSSIRSKGLLQRTGKSCRLRWVNKLRPNLKNGCKFTAEEEKMVIELQAQFGNKWAKIATYLPGRTDNDVKNFWSSRQKRLARLLQTSPAPSKLQRSAKKETPVDFDIPTMEAPKLSSASEGESSSRPMLCLSSCRADYVEPVNMFCSLPDSYCPKLLGFGQDFLQPEFNSFQTSIKFEQQSNFHTQSLSSTFSSQGLHDPNFDVFLETLDVSQLTNEVQFPSGLQFYEPIGCCSSHDDVRENVDNPESFFSEFPADIFEHIEPPPSSPEN